MFRSFLRSRAASGLAASLMAGSAFAYTSSSSVYAAGVDYSAVRSEIAEVMDNLDYEDGSYGPVLVRLAWHSAGSYSAVDGSGGSNNATMRFSPEKDYGGNAGLHIARDLLEPVKAKFPGITYADLYTLAGVVAVEEMGGPTIPWTPGRVDSADNSPTAPDGRLPDASLGADHIREVFTRMGFDTREAVALSGAHCLGRCHTDRSGFDGPWTNAPTTFSNLYFTELLEDKWHVRQWSGPLQYQDPSRKLMMLPTDMAMKTDPEMRKICEEYAADNEVFFRDFAPAFSKLLHLGHPNMGSSSNSSSYTGLMLAGVFASVIGVSLK